VSRDILVSNGVEPGGECKWRLLGIGVRHAPRELAREVNGIHHVRYKIFIAGTILDRSPSIFLGSDRPVLRVSFKGRKGGKEWATVWAFDLANLLESIDLF